MLFLDDKDLWQVLTGASNYNEMVPYMQLLHFLFAVFFAHYKVSYQTH